jgi:SsrA-binding protein
MSNKVEIKNKKARFLYEFLDDYTAGIVLTGSEIKSIRNGKASIVEAYCVVRDGEVWLKNMYIAEYENGSFFNHEPRRDRKLLLNKQEIKKLEKKLKDKGLTIVPSKLFINDKNIAKINIHLAKGKKLHDKRETMKDRDVKRDLDRVMKKYN